MHAAKSHTSTTSTTLFQQNVQHMTRFNVHAAIVIDARNSLKAVKPFGWHIHSTDGEESWSVSA
jgi:hypothetical protein